METTFDLVNNELLDFTNSFSAKQIQYAREFHLHADKAAGWVHANVRLGRFFKNFERPDVRSEAELEKACYARWLATDERLAAYDDAYFTRLAFKDIRIIRMKYLLHKWLKGFDWRVEDGWYGPGETYRSSGGDVSELGKILRAELTTCTRAAFPYFVSFVRTNRSLRRFYLERSRNKVMAECNLSRREAVEMIPCFERGIEHITEIVLGARISSVPKNNEKRRPINVEPLGNSILQYAVGRALMKVLEKLGNSLETGQQTHYQRIADDNVSTIDLSDASDSVTMALVRFLFPKEIVTLLDSLRSKCVEVPIGGDRVWIRPHKISCQGNGFTFPVMTLILLAACKACGDERASVYGDDIIVDNQHARDVVDLIQSIGFVVNETKSFIQSGFRESCGGFYYRSYITCFDISWITNPAELNSTLNKIYLYSKAGGIDSSMWKELHDKLIRHVPSRLRGPAPNGWSDNLALYVWDEAVNAYNRNGACDWLCKRFQRISGSIFRVQIHVPVKGLVKDETSSRRDISMIGNMLRMRAGRPVKRTQRSVTTWVPLKAYGDEQGILMFEPQYEYLRNGERKYVQAILEKDRLTAEDWKAYTLERDYDSLLQAIGEFSSSKRFLSLR